jgi:hypothetical protein
MEQTQCSETSVIKHHTPGNNPKDYTQHLERGKSLKSRICRICSFFVCKTEVLDVADSSWNKQLKCNVNFVTVHYLFQ